MPTNAEFIVLLAGALLCVLSYWALPARHVQSAISVLTLVCLCILSVSSAIWLLAGSLISIWSMQLGDRSGRKGAFFGLTVFLHVAALVWLRDLPGYLWIGAAYFTLRHVHVLSDWWMGTLTRPGLTDYMRYQLFLPVLAAGPIHRFQNFQRELSRRRKNAAELFTGAERALWGAFQAVVIGTWLMTRIERECRSLLEPLPVFLSDWIVGAIDWISLYLTFAGFSSLAIGLSLMTGLRIEENFNAPWRARNLVEFWNRWHMTLTGFCRDYVFRPVSAATRSAYPGVLAAMLAMGLWHETSLYWLGWGLWQGLGITITQLAFRIPTGNLPKSLVSVIGMAFAALWLSATHPVLSRLAEYMSP